MQRLPPPRRRRAFTLLELLVVLVLLGLAAAFVVPVLRLPARSTDQASALERARMIAVRRGESVRLQFEPTGAWTVRATSDTLGTILLAGATEVEPEARIASSVVISALGSCFPEGAVAIGAPAWDPTRCSASRH